MRQIVLATRNAKKIRELERILLAADLTDITLAGPELYAALPDIPETGLTFAENALIKARAVAAATGLPAVADDSGLCVDALNGMPGVLSARWSGRFGALPDGPERDVANLQLVLDQVGDVPDEALGAAFTCAAALVHPDGTEHVVEGVMTGHLVRAPRGEGGFGYDPIFVPEGETRTTAEMSAEEKDAISHRGRAFRALVPLLKG
ncbi:RdgB/HAM1 family non-canonical purine NTP pyrophosphatase [Catenulispora subtropica]|uniref:dITP/XTP pyrophosphatase n=1 Tax=Catenulispora subtropica TaxID=450798 RepID=A0ABN2QZ40_9ACTN